MMTTKPIRSSIYENKKIAMVKLRRKEWRHKMHTLKKKEYQRLRNMVPCIATKPNVSKVTVVEEAVKYIDQLHAALFTKLSARTSATEESLQLDNIRLDANYPKTFTTHVVLRHLMNAASSALYNQQVNDASSPTKQCENNSVACKAIQTSDI